MTDFCDRASEVEERERQMAIQRTLGRCPFSLVRYPCHLNAPGPELCRVCLRERANEREERR